MASITTVQSGQGTPGTHYKHNVSAGSVLGINNSTYPLATHERWQLNLTGTESTANAGSNLQLQAIADDGLTIVGTPLTFNRATGLLTIPTVTGITAGVTQTQAGATAMTGAINRVDTVTTAGDGVKLPLGVAGMVIVVINADSTDSLQVYGAGTDTINGVTTTTGVAQLAGITASYVCASTAPAAAWYRELSA